jgi:hypothetical protein
MLVNRRHFLKGFLASGAIIALAPLMLVVEVPVSSVTFESLVATTLANYRPIFVDIITRPSPIFEALKKNSWIEQGQPVIEPFIFN